MIYLIYYLINQIGIQLWDIAQKNDGNETNEILKDDFEILTIGRTWDNMSLDLEERDAILVEGPEKDRLLKQNINLIEILGQPLYEKWLEQIQPNEKECLDIIVTQIILI